MVKKKNFVYDIFTDEFLEIQVEEYPVDDWDDSSMYLEEYYDSF